MLSYPMLKLHMLAKTFNRHEHCLFLLAHKQTQNHSSKCIEVMWLYLSVGPAHKCIETLAKSSLYPVHLLSRGYECFSGLYPFFRAQDVLYTIKVQDLLLVSCMCCAEKWLWRESSGGLFQELESLTIYPVEILPGQLYMGDYKQATTDFIIKDLNVSAFVNVADQDSILWVKQCLWSEVFIQIYYMYISQYYIVLCCHSWACLFFFVWI